MLWLAALLLLAVGVGLLRYRRASSEPPVDYVTAVVDRGDISPRVTANGTVSPLLSVKVGSQVSGRIQSLLVDYGSPVRKGQVVATIEPSLFQAAAAQARANASAARAAFEKARAELVEAERKYARQEALYREGVASRAEFEAAQAEFEVAKAQRVSAAAGVEQARAAQKQAELNLAYTTIVSPIDGVVISRDVDVGQTVAATLQAPTLFTVAQDLTRMQIDTNVAEADVGKIRPGMPVDFVVDAYLDRTFHGTVRQVRDAAQTIQNVVTYDAVIDVDNSEHLLKPGMTARVTFVYATRTGILRVPNAALRFKPDEATERALGAVPQPAASAHPAAPAERTLWVLRAGRAQRANVRVALSDGSYTEVEGGGLKEGDQVVVEARAKEKERRPLP